MLVSFSMKQSALDMYIQIIEFWKANPPALEGKRHPRHAKHHPVPRAFKKIQNEYKSDVTKLLEMLYNIEETVMVSNRAHFELHVLLTKMFSDKNQEHYQMMCALKRFKGDKFDITPEEYDYKRTLASSTQRGRKDSEETREKKKLMNKGRKHTIIAVQHMNEARNRVDKEKFIANCVKAQNTPEAIKRKQETQLGRKKSKETCERLSKALTGKKATEETREILRAAANRPEVKLRKREIAIARRGYKQTSQVRQNMKIAQNRPETKVLKSKALLIGQNMPKTKKMKHFAHALRRAAKRFSQLIDLSNVTITIKVKDV